MLATVEQHKNFKSKINDKSEKDADILIAKQR